MPQNVFFFAAVSYDIALEDLCADQTYQSNLELHQNKDEVSAPTHPPPRPQP